jgi:hypothetical protein
MLCRYYARRGFGLFYFGLQPESEDTGGILKLDWRTPDYEKLAMLERVEALRSTMGAYMEHAHALTALHSLDKHCI